MTGLPVLVIGGTRSTGLHAARLLHSRGIPVRIFARRPADALRRVGAGFEIVRGDLTLPDTLPAAFDGVGHVIFTAGVRSAHFSRRSVTRATEFDGVRHALDAARKAGFSGRFVYMTSIGVRRSSLFAWSLNVWKGGTMHWRRLAEDAIRSSGFDYSIVRAAFLLNRPARQREVLVRQQESRLTFGEAISRADVAEALVEALFNPVACRTTFEVAWTAGERRVEWEDHLSQLVPDSIVPA